MGVADEALYVAIFGEIGIVPLAVTTSLTINFLRKPPASKGVISVCKLLKVGKSLAVGEVALYSEGTNEPIAHVVGTYSIWEIPVWIRAPFSRAPKLAPWVDLRMYNLRHASFECEGRDEPGCRSLLCASRG